MKIINLVILAITLTLIAPGLALKGPTTYISIWDAPFHDKYGVKPTEWICDETKDYGWDQKGCVVLFGDNNNHHPTNTRGYTCRSGNENGHIKMVEKNVVKHLSQTMGPTQFNRGFLGLKYMSMCDDTIIALFPKDNCEGNVTTINNNLGANYTPGDKRKKAWQNSNYDPYKLYSKSLAWVPIIESRNDCDKGIVHFHKDVCLKGDTDLKLCYSLSDTGDRTLRHSRKNVQPKKFADLSMVKSINFSEKSNYIIFYSKPNYQGFHYRLNKTVLGNVKSDPILEEFFKIHKIGSIKMG